MVAFVTWSFLIIVLENRNNSTFFCWRVWRTEMVVLFVFHVLFLKKTKLATMVRYNKSKKHSETHVALYCLKTLKSGLILLYLCPSSWHHFIRMKWYTHIYAHIISFFFSYTHFLCQSHCLSLSFSLSLVTVRKLCQHHTIFESFWTLWEIMIRMQILFDILKWITIIIPWAIWTSILMLYFWHRLALLGSRFALFCFSLLDDSRSEKSDTTPMSAIFQK